MDPLCIKFPFSTGKSTAVFQALKLIAFVVFSAVD